MRRIPWWRSHETCAKSDHDQIQTIAVTVDEMSTFKPINMMWLKATNMRNILIVQLENILKGPTSRREDDGRYCHRRHSQGISTMDSKQIYKLKISSSEKFCQYLHITICHVVLRHSLFEDKSTNMLVSMSWAKKKSWWRHRMETFSALLAICAGTRRSLSFDVFFYLRLNKRLSKQWWGWWFETPSRSLWRHCNI